MGKPSTAVMVCYHQSECIGLVGGNAGEVKHLSNPLEEKINNDSVSSGERNADETKPVVV